MNMKVESPPEESPPPPPSPRRRGHRDREDSLGGSSVGSMVEVPVLDEDFADRLDFKEEVIVDKEGENHPNNENKSFWKLAEAQTGTAECCVDPLLELFLAGSTVCFGLFVAIYISLAFPGNDEWLRVWRGFSAVSVLFIAGFILDTVIRLFAFGPKTFFSNLTSSMEALMTAVSFGLELTVCINLFQTTVAPTLDTVYVLASLFKLFLFFARYVRFQQLISAVVVSIFFPNSKHDEFLENTNAPEKVLDLLRRLRAKYPLTVTEEEEINWASFLIASRKLYSAIIMENTGATPALFEGLDQETTNWLLSTYSNMQVERENQNENNTNGMLGGGGNDNNNEHTENNNMEVMELGPPILATLRRAQSNNNEEATYEEPTDEIDAHFYDHDDDEDEHSIKSGGDGNFSIRSGKSGKRKIGSFHSNASPSIALNVTVDDMIIEEEAHDLMEEEGGEEKYTQRTLEEEEMFDESSTAPNEPPNPMIGRRTSGGSCGVMMEDLTSFKEALLVETTSPRRKSRKLGGGRPSNLSTKKGQIGNPGSLVLAMSSDDLNEDAASEGVYTDEDEYPYRTGNAQSFYNTINHSRTRTNDFSGPDFRMKLLSEHARLQQIRWTQNQVDTLNANLDEWSFDVFEANEFVGGRPLALVFLAAMRKNRLFTTFKALKKQRVLTFITAIENGYRVGNPYHNRIHAADVVQTTHYFLTHDILRNAVSTIDVLCALVAAAIHDFQHPGTNNSFLVATQDKLALRYNDRAVLEHMHVAAAFELMRARQCDLLKSVGQETYLEARETVIQMVLATDMSHHFEGLDRFNNEVIQYFENRNMQNTITTTTSIRKKGASASIDSISSLSKDLNSSSNNNNTNNSSNNNIQPNQNTNANTTTNNNSSNNNMSSNVSTIDDDANSVNGDALPPLNVRRTLLKTTLHCADVSNPAKKPKLCQHWAMLVQEEFFRQGDMERENGLKISMFMDRNKPSFHKCQIGFITIIVKPLFASYCKFLTSLKPQVDWCLNENLRHWEKKQAEEEATNNADNNNMSPTNINASVASPPPSGVGKLARRTSFRFADKLKSSLTRAQSTHQFGSNAPLPSPRGSFKHRRKLAGKHHTSASTTSSSMDIGSSPKQSSMDISHLKSSFPFVRAATDDNITI